MLTKIATGKTVEFFLFDAGQESEYFAEVCGFCYDPDCNDDCTLPNVPCLEECDGCMGGGRVKFLMQPADGGESYFVITLCGFCDGIGLV